MRQTMKKASLLLSNGLCFALTMYAQTLPACIPPSPEVSALFKYKEYSVNNATGLVPVSVPIYDLKCGSLSVPISIGYNTGGRRVFDVTGPVGLGWSLNCGGAISRTIHGKPDDQYFFPSAFRPASSLSNDNTDDYRYLAGLYYNYGQYDASPLEDAEYDIFSYYCGNSSGKFIVEHSAAGTFVRPVKPTTDRFSGGSGLTAAFPSTITDGSGVVYAFGVNEIAGGTNSGVIDPPVTGKLLTSITSADGSDVISFAYTSVSQLSRTFTQQLTYTDCAFPESYAYPPVISGPANLQDWREYQVQRLTEISCRQGKVKFLLHPNTDRIKTIQIFNQKNELIKSIELLSSVLDSPAFGTVDPAYKLDKVLFNTPDGQTGEQYAFDYYASSNFYTQNRDYWGYLNSAANTIVVPSVSNINVYNYYVWQVYNLNGGNRGADGGAKSGTLKSITYPTGGSTEFSYESNRFGWAQNVISGPGLRVSQIKTTDNNGGVYLKTYKYGLNEDGTGSVGYGNFFAPAAIGSEKIILKNATPYGAVNVVAQRKRVYSSEFNPFVQEAYSEPVQYGMVTEYNGTPDVNEGKTEFYYEIPYGKLLTGNMPGPVFPGTTPPPYINTILFSQFARDGELTPPHTLGYNLWLEPVLSGTRIYKNLGTGTNGAPVYDVVKSTGNTYTYTQTGTYAGIHINKYIEFQSVSTYSQAGDDPYSNLPVFLYADYAVSTGRMELSSTVETDKTPNGTITRQTTYRYNDKLQPVKITTTSSKGEELNTQVRYAPDFISDPALGAVSQAMVNNNMIGVPVEQVQLKGTTFLGGTKNIYSTWSNGASPGIRLQNIQSRQGANAYETRVQINAYDAKGNVLEQQKANDVKTVFVWGLNGLYPMAQVIGADIAAVSPLVNQAVLDDPNSTAIQIKAQLDNLRAGLAGTKALVTTYTYRPLVGMTSQTDPAGRTTYYEYDSFGRLLLIRDKDNNVLKKFDYKYSGQ